jgi:MoaA/NifB/PqqE/SkfB family radical SAM enzyme
MYTTIEQIHLEITSKCNARCPSCNRNIAGSDQIAAGLEEVDLPVDLIKNILYDSSLENIKTIYINGNYGDIVMHDNAIEILKAIKEIKPKCYIHINTNGGARNAEFWKSLAQYANLVEFGIDGLEDTHSLYRRNTVFSTVIKNAKTFIKAGGKATWMMTVFKHNQHQVDACRTLSEQLGFSKFGHRLNTRSGVGQGITHCSSDLKTIDYSLENTTDENIGKEFPISLYTKAGEKYNISARHHLETLNGGELAIIRLENAWRHTYGHLANKIPNCRAKNTSTVYISAQGYLYPCCWVGNQKISSYLILHNEHEKLLSSCNLTIENLNLRKHTVSEILKFGYFEKIEENLNPDSDVKLKKCREICTENSHFSSQNRKLFQFSKS